MMRVTVLIENTLPENSDLTAEYGLSFYIQSGGHNLLFDTGLSGACFENARRLGLPIAAVEAAALSHAHFDHGGGLLKFVQANSNAPVYLRSAARGNFYSGWLWSRRSVGLAPELFSQYAGRLRWLDENVEILPGAHLVGQIPHTFPLPRGDRFLFQASGGKIVPDRFEHEQVLVIREPDGMVLFTGCSHSGVLNMIAAARAAFPGERIKALVGGFHLTGIPFYNVFAETAANVTALAYALEKMDIPRIYTMHCTSVHGFQRMRAVLGSRLVYLATGQTVKL
jgi:7,8-dihydropterin-6-yl-methyl-4-(beta-D-ribofuranosyl)aminobenzene 5'-phosphate synthase